MRRAGSVLVRRCAVIFTTDPVVEARLMGRSSGRY
jgi:hypothetical protein